jgi:hypothetical protein
MDEPLAFGGGQADASEDGSRYRLLQLVGCRRLRRGRHGRSLLLQLRATWSGTVAATVSGQSRDA